MKIKRILTIILVYMTFIAPVCSACEISTASNNIGHNEKYVVTGIGSMKPLNEKQSNNTGTNFAKIGAELGGSTGAALGGAAFGAMSQGHPGASAVGAAVGVVAGLMKAFKLW